MSLRHLFLPQIIKFPDTPFNRHISLHQYLLQPTLMVDGLIESGDILTHIWKTGIKKLIPRTFVPQSILLLGLGGGSNTLLVRKLYPKAKITAVEIDPLMAHISKTHFGVDKVKNLEIVIADALDFVGDFDGKTHFDLVLVDCFEGKYIPKKLENLDFIQGLKDHARYVLINRIFWYDYHLPSLDFMRALTTRFFFVTAHTRSNLLISLV